VWVQGMSLSACLCAAVFWPGVRVLNGQDCECTHGMLTHRMASVCARGCPQHEIVLGDISRELWLLELLHVQLCIGGVTGEVMPVCVKMSKQLLGVVCAGNAPCTPTAGLQHKSVGFFAAAMACLRLPAGACLSRERRRPCRAGCVSEREVDYPFCSAGWRTARCS